MPQQTQRALPFLAALVLAASLSALAAEPNLSGIWTATVHNPGVSSGDATLELEQTGEKLSGHIISASGRKSEVAGTVVGTQIQFSYNSTVIRVRTESGDKPLTLNFSGSASNDEIDVKSPTPMGEATLKAKRK